MKKVLEGILKLVDLNANNPCAGDAAWQTSIGDEVIIKDFTLDFCEYFEEFLGKKIRLTIEVIE